MTQDEPPRNAATTDELSRSAATTDAPSPAAADRAAERIGGATTAGRGDPRLRSTAAEHPADRLGVRRRDLLALGTAAAAGLAGCTSGGGDDSAGGTDSSSNDGGDDGDGGTAADGDDGVPDFQEIEDPPDAVYVPTHFEAMRHLDPVDAGPYELVPMVTYPHRFWTVTGDRVEPAEPGPDDDVHLMVTVRDPETGTILPAETGLELEVARAGEPGSVVAPWPMLSQEMGFHVGDNVPLDGDGTYEVSVRVGAIGVDLTGEFAGRFDEPGRGTFTFEFDQAFREAVVGGIRYVDETHWGEPGALANHAVGEHGDHDDGHGNHGDGGNGDHDDGHEDEHDGDDGDSPSEHDVESNDEDAPTDQPHGREPWSAGEGRHRYGTYRRGPAEGELPPAADLPGTLQGTPVTGDAVFATTLLDADSRFVDAGYSLAVSPRTPYNRSMLPMMGLSYELSREGSVVTDGDLRAALDHELGYHYVTTVETVNAGDVLTVTVDSPPQAARHEGYETAFREMPPVEVELDP